MTSFLRDAVQHTSWAVQTKKIGKRLVRWFVVIEINPHQHLTFSPKKWCVCVCGRNFFVYVSKVVGIKKRKLCMCVCIYTRRRRKKGFWGSWPSCGVQGFCVLPVGLVFCVLPRQRLRPPPQVRTTVCTLYTLAPPFTRKMFCLF
jgi:hypothetical protein